MKIRTHRTPTTDVAGKTVASEKPTAPVPRSVLKTRQAYAQETTPAKRKARLKEVESFCNKLKSDFEVESW